MSFLAESGTLTSPATTGAQITSLSSGIWNGASPKVLLIWHAENTTDGFVSGLKLGFGVALSSTSRAVISMASENGKSTSNVYRRHGNTRCVALLDYAQAISEHADLVSFGANQFTLNWSLVQPAANIYNFLVLGGDDLTNVHLNEFQSPAATGNQSYTGVGFQPDAILCLSATNNAAPPATSGNAFFCLGVSDFTNHVAGGVGISNGQPTSNAECVQTASLMHSPNLAGLTNWRITPVSADTDGYTLNWNNTAESGYYFWILALKGPKCKVLAADQPATNSTVSRSIGFAPKAALFQSCMSESSTSVGSGLRFGIGGWDSQNNRVFAGCAEEDNQPTTNNDRIQDSNESFKHIDNAQDILGSMSPSASGNNLNEAWTDCDGTQREHGMLVLGVEGVTPPVTSDDLSYQLLRP